MQQYVTKVITKLKNIASQSKKMWLSFSRIKKILLITAALTMAIILSMRIIAFRYQRSESLKDQQFGTTFVASQARYYNLDPKSTYLAILDNLNIKNLRLVSYWSEGEKEKGKYDFTDLDWQFAQAEKRGVKISLSLGLRQPRWPECHQPEWSKDLSKEEWYPSLKAYISEVVKRYSSSPALHSYQLENEYFLKDFGVCPDYSRERLVDEFNLVKKLDPKTPIILTRSNNYGGFALKDPKADIYGISIYRKVHNKKLGYITYPFPAWYYAFLAQGQKSLTGKPSIIHEFQLEPWTITGDTKNTSIEEQNKTMGIEDIKKNINFAKKTGIKEVYLWGSEWWYWRLQNGDPTIWNTVKEEIN